MKEVGQIMRMRDGASLLPHLQQFCSLWAVMQIVNELKMVMTDNLKLESLG